MVGLSWRKLNCHSIGLMANPKNVNAPFGGNTNLSGRLMNPKSCKSKAVFFSFYHFASIPVPCLVVSRNHLYKGLSHLLSVLG